MRLHMIIENEKKENERLYLFSRGFQGASKNLSGGLGDNSRLPYDPKIHFLDTAIS